MKLKELRKQTKKTQADISKELKIPLTTYNNYESGRNEIPMEILCKLADIYEVSIDYLVGRDFGNEVGYLTKVQKDFVKAFLSLNPDNQMNAVVYVPDSNGIISAYEVPEYSVVQYLTGELKKAVAAKDAKLITLISDILYLGQQSQIFIGYKTSEAEWPTTIVAKQGYELTPSTFVKPDPSTSITKVNRDNCDTSIADWKNVGLLIGNSTKLQLVFAAPKLEGLTVKIYVSGVEQDVSYGDLENANLALDEKGRYILVLEGIKVSAYNLPIEAKFFDDDGNQVGSVLTTSVNSFVAANYDKKDAKIQAMLEAVYNYGLSVKAYFG